MRSRPNGLRFMALGSLTMLACTPAMAQTSLSTAVNAIGTAPVSAPQAPSAPVPKTGYQFFLSERLRAEGVNWWPTDKADGAYSFLGSLLRFGVSRQTSQEDLYLELQNTTLIGLPTRAIASAPQGQLGLGATYFASNGSRVATLFPHQAYFRFKDPTVPGQALKLGRFEYSDGMETVPKDPSLLWLKKNRIGERLIGPFGFSDVGRSEDLFGQAILRSAPAPGMTTPLFTIRGDIHSLRLANSKDLWYSGGGAYDNALFGYNGRPSNGKSGLGTLFDLSVDYAPVKSTPLTAYLAYANGGNMISSLYKSRDSVYSYLELNFRY